MHGYILSIYIKVKKILRLNTLFKYARILNTVHTEMVIKKEMSQVT